MRFFSLACFALVVPAVWAAEVSGPGDGGRLLALESVSTANASLVFLTFSAAPELNSPRYLSTPDRCYLDFNNTQIDPNLAERNFPVSDSRVVQIRMAQNQPTITRVVIDLQNQADCRVSSPDGTSVLIEVKAFSEPIAETREPEPAVPESPPAASAAPESDASPEPPPSQVPSPEAALTLAAPPEPEPIEILEPETTAPLTDLDRHPPPLSLESNPTRPDGLVLDEIVARVDQDIITLQDVKKELLLIKSDLEVRFSNPAEIQREMDRSKPRVLTRMIEQKLLLQEARFQYSDDLVEPYVAELMEEKSREAGSETALVAELAKRNVSLSEYRNMLWERLVVNQLITDAVHSKASVSGVEVEQYYQQNLDTFIQPAQIELAEIVLRAPATDPSDPGSPQKLKSLLDKGEPFDELARLHSEGSTADQGGTIGWFTKGSLAPELEELVWNLKPGHTSAPIESGSGWRIVKVLDQKASAPLPLDQVKDRIRSGLLQRNRQIRYEAFLKELFENHFVKVVERYQHLYQGAPGS